MTPEQLDELVAGLDEVKAFLSSLDEPPNAAPVRVDFVNDAWSQVTYMREMFAEAAHRAAFERLAESVTR